MPYFARGAGIKAIFFLPVRLKLDSQASHAGIIGGRHIPSVSLDKKPD